MDTQDWSWGFPQIALEGYFELGRGLWGHEFVFRHESGMMSLSTGLLPRMCEVTISSRSASVTPPYQTASGYTTTVGPCSHWSRHPDLFARTVLRTPCSANFFLNAFCNSPSAVGSQQPRGCPSGRWLVQTKICFSNFGIASDYNRGRYRGLKHGTNSAGIGGSLQTREQ